MIDVNKEDFKIQTALHEIRNLPPTRNGKDSPAFSRELCDQTYFLIGAIIHNAERVGIKSI